MKGESLLFVSGQRSGVVLLDTKTGQIYSIAGSGKSYRCAAHSFMPPTQTVADDRPGVLLPQRAYKEARNVSIVGRKWRKCVHYLGSPVHKESPHCHPKPPRCYHVLLLLRWDCKLRLAEAHDRDGITKRNIPALGDQIAVSAVAECPFVLPSSKRVLVIMLRRMIRNFAQKYLALVPPKSIVKFGKVLTRDRFDDYLKFLKTETTYWSPPEMYGESVLIHSLKKKKKKVFS